MEIIQRIIPVAVNSKDENKSLAEVLKNIQPFEVEAPEVGDKKTLNPPPLVGQMLLALQEGLPDVTLMSTGGKPSVKLFKPVVTTSGSKLVREGGRAAV